MTGTNASLARVITPYFFIFHPSFLIIGVGKIQHHVLFENMDSTFVHARSFICELSGSGLVALFCQKFARVLKVGGSFVPDVRMVSHAQERLLVGKHDPACDCGDVLGLQRIVFLPLDVFLPQLHLFHFLWAIHWWNGGHIAIQTFGNHLQMDYSSEVGVQYIEL